MADLNERDAKLVQWLNEAHAKEAELEADLTAHIALTEKQSYKKRLQQHLKETRDHKRRVASRVKKLGGSSANSPRMAPKTTSAIGLSFSRSQTLKMNGPPGLSTRRASR